MYNNEVHEEYNEVHDEVEEYDEFFEQLTYVYSQEEIPILSSPLLEEGKEEEKKPIAIVPAPWAGIKPPVISLKEEIETQEIESKRIKKQKINEVPHQQAYIPAVAHTHDKIVINGKTIVGDRRSLDEFKKRYLTEPQQRAVAHPLPRQSDNTKTIEIKHEKPVTPSLPKIDKVISSSDNWLDWLPDYKDPNEKIDAKNKLKRTRFCRTVLDGKFCDVKGCKFAHTTEELEPDVCSNPGCKNCFFIHPETETHKEYCERLNLTWRPKIDYENFDYLVDKELKIIGIRRLNPRYKSRIAMYEKGVGLLPKKEAEEIVNKTRQVVTKVAPWSKMVSGGGEVTKITQPTTFPIIHKNENCEKIKVVYQDPKRTAAYSLLTGNTDISHLKKTKFCQNIILKGGKGGCDRKFCNFAHSVKELVFPQCVFGAGCKKESCKFLHQWETLDSYKKRINFQVPKNVPLI
jgi:hypothetical protein